MTCCTGSDKSKETIYSIHKNTVPVSSGSLKTFAVAVIPGKWPLTPPYYVGSFCFCLYII